ncbi:hypothetical protein SUGI_0638920 [Cryptomeria japonica]|nr:hypothetical protein SUGI_0638920 [Cryptomeria japonica]
MGNSLICASTKVYSETEIDEVVPVTTTKRNPNSQYDSTKSWEVVPVEKKIHSVKRVKIKISKHQLEDLLSQNVSTQDVLLKLLKRGVQSLPDRKIEEKDNDRWRPALESIVEVN